MIQIISGLIGGLGFAILFGARRKYLPYIAVNAGLSWAVYLAVDSLLGAFAANVASAAFCSLVAAALAPRLRAPKIVLQMPATVPMIPGGSLYYTMYYLFSGDMANAGRYLLSTAKAIFGMAVGFALVSVLLQSLEERRARAA